MKPLRRRLGALLATLVSVGVTLLVFEVALRLRPIGPVAPDPSAGPIGQLFTRSANPELGYEHARDVRVRFPSHPVGDRATAPWEVWIDANGLGRNGRGDPLASELRGICLGDSTMFGAGLNDEETIPAQLSAIVSEKLGLRFECLNLGVSNYTTAQEVALFRHVDPLRWGPSVVVLGIFTNDFKVGARDREAATERQRASLAYCRKHDLRCVDLLDRFWGRPVDEYFRPGDDSHPHAEAARISAALLAEAVVPALAAGR